MLQYSPMWNSLAPCMFLNLDQGLPNNALKNGSILLHVVIIKLPRKFWISLEKCHTFVLLHDTFLIISILVFNRYSRKLRFIFHHFRFCLYFQISGAYNLFLLLWQVTPFISFVHKEFINIVDPCTSIATSWCILWTHNSNPGTLQKMQRIPIISQHHNFTTHL